MADSRRSDRRFAYGLGLYFAPFTNGSNSIECTLDDLCIGVAFDDGKFAGLKCVGMHKTEKCRESFMTEMENERSAEGVRRSTGAGVVGVGVKSSGCNTLRWFAYRGPMLCITSWLPIS